MRLAYYYAFYLVGLLFAITALGVNVALAFDLIQPDSYYDASKSVGVIAMAYLTVLAALTIRSWATGQPRIP